MSALKSGLLFRDRPVDTEREIKDRISFTAISLVDHIDIFNPPLLFLSFDRLNSHFLFSLLSA